MFSNSFAGIAPSSVLLSVAMRCLGGALGYALYPYDPAIARELSPHLLR